MANTFAKLTLFAPILAAATGCGAVNASSEARALSLNVVESADSVEIEVVANSSVTQQIEFKAELTGSSNSRHNSSSTVAAGDTQVLSRMKISSSKGWCAKVDVSESSGANYTLTAGDCGLI
ncbi:hypothetical protein [Erythrobacter sp.]|uniref:hypothetical protein n=1 Tax=Sphingomonadales TaxID=204457 RepID=UPI003264E395